MQETDHEDSDNVQDQHVLFRTAEVLNKHLQRLELLRLAEDAEKYVTTEKGLELFRRYASLQDLLR